MTGLLEKDDNSSDNLDVKYPLSFVSIRFSILRSNLTPFHLFSKHCQNLTYDDVDKNLLLYKNVYKYRLLVGKMITTFLVLIENKIQFFYIDFTDYRALI